MPGLRLVIGMDGDRRAWVQVANVLLEGIASGAVRAGSRVPPVTSLGVETTVPLSAAVRAFRELASEGVLHWVPRLGYHVRTSITVPVGTRPRRDGGLMAVLPAGSRQQAGDHVPAGPGTGDR
jgi:DNA-binding transcriptional MocR family regulator